MGFKDNSDVSYPLEKDFWVNKNKIPPRTQCTGFTEEFLFTYTHFSFINVPGKPSHKAAVYTPKG